MTKKITYIIGVIIALLIFSFFSTLFQNVNFFPSDNANKNNKEVLVLSLEDEPNFSLGMMDNFLKPYLDKDIESQPTKAMLVDAAKCFKEGLLLDVINSNNTNISSFLSQESEITSNSQLKKTMKGIFLELDDEVQNIINYCKKDHIELPLNQLSKDVNVIPEYTYLQCDVDHSIKIDPFPFDAEQESSVATVKFLSEWKSIEVQASTKNGLFIMNFDAIFDYQRDNCDIWNEKEISCSSKFSNDTYTYDRKIKLNRVSGELFYSDHASEENGSKVRVLGSGFCKKISSNPQF